MPRGVTTLSGDIYWLHMLIFWVVTVIGIAVFGAMIVALVKFRRSKGAQPDQKLLHSTKAEILWTAIPVAILVGMAVPAARTLIQIEDASATDINIKVTAYDAARQRDAVTKPGDVPNYLLSVDNPLVVPVGRKVRLLVTSQDVIHAWWVPDLAIKKDAIPGMVNEMWFQVRPDKPGIYRGQCTELCGRDHGFMPIVVEALSEADYAAWLESKKPAAPESPGATDGGAVATVAAN
jgi:cytochrome c oxidase subunit 2